MKRCAPRIRGWRAARKRGATSVVQSRITSELRRIWAGALPITPRELSSLATAPPARAGDLAAVAQRLNSTLLAYWVAEDELFIWVVAPDGRVRTARVDVLESTLRTLTRATSPFADKQ